MKKPPINGKNEISSNNTENNNKKLFIVILLLLLFAVIGITAIMRLNAMKKEIVVFETTLGNFEVELNREKAPVSVENFVNYVKSGFYDGLIFHRVISNFMVQGGGFDINMDEKDTSAPIKNEAGNGLSNDKYTIAMARTSVVDSATSQFFISVENNAFLNHKDDSQKGYGYAVFGKMISGFDVIEKIRYVPTDSLGNNNDVPKTPVVIKKAYMK